jgi:hypothetical protein
MLRIIWIVLRAVVSAFRSRRELVLENLALRQQLAMFKSRCRPSRIRLADRAFWIVLHRFWSRWVDALVIELSGQGQRRPTASSVSALVDGDAVA